MTRPTKPVSTILVLMVLNPTWLLCIVLHTMNVMQLMAHACNHHACKDKLTTLDIDTITIPQSLGRSDGGASLAK